MPAPVKVPIPAAASHVSEMVPELTCSVDIQVNERVSLPPTRTRYRCGMNRGDQSSVWTKTDADLSLATLEKRPFDGSAVLARFLFKRMVNGPPFEF